MDTHRVVGTERVEGVCSTYKQVTMLAEQHLDEVTALSLWKEKKKQQNKNTKGKDLRGARKSQGAERREEGGFRQELSSKLPVRARRLPVCSMKNAA